MLIIFSIHAGFRTGGAVFRCVATCAVFAAFWNNYRCLEFKRCRRSQRFFGCRPSAFASGRRSEFLGSESPACVSVKPCRIKVSRRLELGPDKSEAVQPSPHGEFFVFLLLFLGACCFYFLCHFAKREAKLNVGLELSCVDPALSLCGRVVELKKSELYLIRDLE